MDSLIKELTPVVDNFINELKDGLECDLSDKQLDDLIELITTIIRGKL